MDDVKTNLQSGTDNAEKSLKCCSCGTTVMMEGDDAPICPSCGHSCSKEHCEFLYTSNEGF